MSNNQPTATAVIRFYEDKRVTVEIDSLTGISPRRLEIANNLLMREYRGKRGAHNANLHRKVREEKVAAEKKAIEDEKAFHEAEDKRLKAAAAEDQAPSAEVTQEPEAEVEETEVEDKVEVE